MSGRESMGTSSYSAPCIAVGMSTVRPPAEAGGSEISKTQENEQKVFPTRDIHVTSWIEGTVISSQSRLAANVMKRFGLPKCQDPAEGHDISRMGVVDC